VVSSGAECESLAGSTLQFLRHHLFFQLDLGLTQQASRPNVPHRQSRDIKTPVRGLQWSGTISLWFRRDLAAI